MTGKMPVLPRQIQEINHTDTENTEKKKSKWCNPSDTGAWFCRNDSLSPSISAALQNSFLRELCDFVVKKTILPGLLLVIRYVDDFRSLWLEVKRQFL